MRKPSEFIDQWGLLDKKYMPDGGDSGQREGMYWSLRGMIKTPPDPKWDRYVNGNGKNNLTYWDVMKKIHPTPGLILRHSNLEWDASDWDRMSRDQFQPNIIAAGYWSKDELRKLHRGHLKRAYLFTSNTRKNGATKANHGQFVAGEVRDYSWKMPDPTFFEIWGNFIRSFKAWWLWPLLLVLDLELLAGSIRWRVAPKHNIAMNHTLSAMQAWDRLPTPWSWLAIKIMPIPKLIDFIKDHFNDFPDDMEFFGPMFEEAWNNIK